MNKQTQSRMQRDFGAFRAKLTAIAAIGLVGAYEMRDDSSITKISEAIDKIGRAFEEYKKTNDQRIEAIKAGKPTADFEAKLAEIDKHLDGLAEQKSRLEKLEGKLARPGATHGNSGEVQETEEETKHREAVIDWMRKSKDPEANARVVEAQREIESRANAGPRERRAAQVITSIGSAGGYALPQIIERQISRLSVDISPIRQIATVRTVGSTNYTEIIDTNGAAFEWVGEGDARNVTNTPNLAPIVPTFGIASAKPTATEESLDDLFFDVESWLITSAAEAIAQGEGAAFINGDGVKKPTGFLAGPAPVVAGDNARTFGTLQYIASGQAAAMPTSADIFYDLIYALRARYRANARWVTSKAVLSALRKYKDAQGEYLWQPSLIEGQPAMFVGYGITEAEDMPAIAANAFPIAFGDFKEGYLIADRVDMRITRDEITSSGFVKFYVRKRVGGKLRNTQAIKLLKIAAA